MSENAFEASLESTEMDDTKKQALVRNLCDLSDLCGEALVVTSIASVTGLWL